MSSVVFLVPGSLDTRTGGSIYDRRMVDGLRERGWPVTVHELDDSFPCPTREALDHAARTLAAVPDAAIVVIDSLAFGAMPALIEREASRLRIVALMHLPLGADPARDGETTARLAVDERRALAAAALVIATGSTTVALLAAGGVSRDRIVVVEPGTDEPRAPRRPAGTHAPGRLKPTPTYDAQGRLKPAPTHDVVTGGSKPIELLCVATLNPGKGHEILLQALAALPCRHWHLTCAGSLTRHPQTADRVRTAVRKLGLEDHVSLVGELDETGLADCYDNADLFVLPTLRETYGMAVAEALAHGLPIVSTTTGAIPDLVGDAAGLLVPPGDVAAFTDALARALGDATLRAQLASGARRARTCLRSWDRAVGEMVVALQRAAEASHG